MVQSLMTTEQTCRERSEDYRRIAAMLRHAPENRQWVALAEQWTRLADRIAAQEATDVKGQTDQQLEGNSISKRDLVPGV
jgi:hypothetical protein